MQKIKEEEDKLIHLATYVTKDIYNYIKFNAEKYDVSLSCVVEEIIKEYMKDNPTSDPS